MLIKYSIRHSLCQSSFTKFCLYHQWQNYMQNWEKALRKKLTRFLVNLSKTSLFSNGYRVHQHVGTLPDVDIPWDRPGKVSLFQNDYKPFHILLITALWNMWVNIQYRKTSYSQWAFVIPSIEKVTGCRDSRSATNKTKHNRVAYNSTVYNPNLQIILDL